MRRGEIPGVAPWGSLPAKANVEKAGDWVGGAFHEGRMDSCVSGAERPSMGEHVWPGRDLGQFWGGRHGQQTGVG